MNDASLAAESAARLLKADIFVDSVQAAENEIIVEWSHADTIGKREQAHSELQALHRIVRTIERIVKGHPSQKRAAELESQVEETRDAHAAASNSGDEVNGD